MIISFFGHRDFRANISEEEVVKIIDDVAKGDFVEFYLGCYGNFDSFAYNCATKYKQLCGNCKLTFVTPYLTDNSRCKGFAQKCDQTVYPEIEKVPLKFAIIERNKWVINRSDFIIFYRCIGWGTGIAYYYAEEKKKPFINLYR